MLLHESFKKIDTFILDVDGVLTDGQLLIDDDGNLLRSMNIKDGYAMQLAHKQGYKIVIISGGNNIAVQKRLQGLGITENHFGISNKLEKLQQLMQDNIIDISSTLYMGDDMPDLAPMQLCALPCAPADACMEVLEAATYVSPLKGGNGCVRDVIEKVLKLKGDWQ